MLQNPIRLLIIGFVLLAWSGHTHAVGPGNGELDAAINGGDFGLYFANLSAWLKGTVVSALP